MSISEIFVSAFEGDATLVAMLPGGLHQASSLGVGANPKVPVRKYMVWNEMPSIPIPGAKDTSDAQTRMFYFWVYDDPGDYEGINAVLGEVRRVCRSLAFVKVGTYVVMGQEWGGLSALMPPDPQYHVISRYGSVRFAVNQ